MSEMAPELVLRDVIHDGVNCDVEIRGNRFARIEPVAASARPPILAGPDQVVIEGRGRLAITPPFYNAHTHAAMTLLRGYADDLDLHTWLTEHIWPAEAQLTRRDIAAGSRLAMLEMIKSGTVFFNDMYWGQAGTARAVTQMGMRATIGLLSFTTETGELSPVCAAANAELLELAPDLPDRISIAHAPHAVYTVSEALLSQVAAKAGEDGRQIHVHASETESEVADCLAAHGATPIGLLERLGLLGPGTVLAHCVHLTPADLELIVARGAVIAHCPTSNLKLCSGQFDLPRAWAAGARLALGTDGAASNNSLSMLAEAKTASLLAKTVSGEPTAGRASNLLELATAGGAAAFGLDAGRIAVGTLADAILVDLDHPAMIADHHLKSNLVYSADSAVIDTVICDGRVLMAHREVPGEADIVAAAREAAARVRRRR